MCTLYNKVCEGSADVYWLIGTSNTIISSVAYPNLGIVHCHTISNDYVYYSTTHIIIHVTSIFTSRPRVAVRSQGSCGSLILMCT
jgi:hypothetical protein